MSRKKDVMSWLLVLLVLAGIGAAALYTLWPQLQPHTTLHIGDGIFTARVAKTAAEREKGLGGTGNLREDQAMIFVYESDGKRALAMKDMNYPVDIVWLDKDKKVVYIVKNAPPESYPYEEFAPKKKARYAIKFLAGTVGKKKITIGSTAMFDENKLKGLKL